MPDKTAVATDLRCDYDPRIGQRTKLRVVPAMSGQWQPGENLSSPPSDSSDHWLVRWARAGDQDAATQLYIRYARRLTALVKRRCSMHWR